MEKIKLGLLTDEDLEEIDTWKKAYKGTQEFESIVQYILNNESRDIKKLLKILHDKNPIGNDELNLVLVGKKDNEIVGVIVADMFDKRVRTPELYIHFIFTRPNLQSKGIGKAILTQFFSNMPQFFQAKPTSIFANINKTNMAGQKLFSSFGFQTGVKETYGSDFVQFRANYDKILTNINTLEKEQ